MNSASSRIKVENLNLGYQKLQVLSDLNFEVGSGEIIGVLGKSGCGKTSLLKSLALFVAPQKGRIALDGKDVFLDGRICVDVKKHRERVCLVFQDYSLFPSLTGLENITFAYIRRKNIPKNQAEAEAYALAKEFDLTPDVLNRYPQTYSGGQAQRIALLRALILKPEVLLLDEITSALDPDSIASVIEAIRRLRKDSVSQGLSVILVTHLIRFAEEIADRILFLDGGEIVADRPAKGFFEDASHPSIEAFVRRFRYSM